MTKHALVALTENLYHSLSRREAKIKASVLCPGWVQTRIADCERNRPPELQDDPSTIVMTPEIAAAQEEVRQACETGMSPDKVADCVFQAVQDEKFYILTHPEFTPLVEARMAALVRGQNPVDLRPLMEG